MPHRQVIAHENETGNRVQTIRWAIYGSFSCLALGMLTPVRIPRCCYRQLPIDLLSLIGLLTIGSLLSFRAFRNSTNLWQRVFTGVLFLLNSAAFLGMTYGFLSDLPG